MSGRACWLVCLWLVIGWMACADRSEAAVHSGVIESIDEDGGQLVVRFPTKQTSKTFKLTKTTAATLDGKKTSFDMLQPGQTVSVTTDSKDELATKLIARTAVAKAAPSDEPAAVKPARKEKESAKKKSNDRNQPVATDWPQHRGPLRDNISRETGLLEEWPASGPEVAFTTEGLGEGYSSVAVTGGRIYTLGTRGGDELLIVLDEKTGERVWELRTGSVRQDGTGNGPRGTPTIDGDRVYALGANGDLVCAKADTGDKIWEANILRDFEGENIVWGISESVLIDGEKLICTPGGKQATLAALNKLTGEPLWKSKVPGNPQAAYSSPIAIEAGGVRQYVTFVHTGVVGVKADDGTPLWGQEASANGTANCSTPLADDNFVFTASGYGTGGALFRLAGGNKGAIRSDVVYTTKDMQNHHGGMVLLDGFIYGFDEAVLKCLDARTGKPAWQNRSVGKGSLTCADGMLYLRSEGGPVALVAASPKGYIEKGRFDPPRSNRAAWSHPVVVRGRLYLREQDKLMVYNVADK